MRCDVITLFPEMVTPVLESSMLKRAQEKGLLEVKVHNLRDYTLDKHKVADDLPYGGGAGMVLKAEPILRAVEQIRQPYEQRGENLRVPVALSARPSVHPSLCPTVGGWFTSDAHCLWTLRGHRRACADCSQT